MKNKIKKILIIILSLALIFCIYLLINHEAKNNTSEISVLINHEAENNKSETFSCIEKVSTYSSENFDKLFFKDDYLYALGENLKIFRIDEGKIEEIVSISDGVYWSDLYVDDEYIYTIGYLDGLRIYTFDGINITNIFQDANISANKIVSNGEYFYIAKDSDLFAYTFDGVEFKEIDRISNVDNGWYLDININNEYIFVGRSLGLTVYTFEEGVFDYLGSFNTIRPYKIASSENYVYIADDLLAAYTFDGVEFKEVGRLDEFLRTENIYADNNYIYLSDGSGGFKLYTFNGSDFIKNANKEDEYVSDIAIDDYLYIDDSYGFSVNKINKDYCRDLNKGKWDEFISQENSTDNQLNNAYFVEIEKKLDIKFNDMYFDENYIYATDGGLYVLDKFFNKIDYIDDSTVYGSANGVTSDGKYIYIANGLEGVYAYSFENRQLSKVGTIKNGKLADGITSDGKYIYVSNFFDGISVYTFDGGNFKEVAFTESDTRTSGIFLNENFIYLSAEADGLKIYTFDGNNLREENCIETEDLVRNVFVIEDKIFIANYRDGVKIYDNFKESLQLNKWGYTEDVYSDGKYIYLGNGVSQGLKVYTIEGEEIEGDNYAEYVSNIFYDNGYIYVTTSYGTRFYKVLNVENAKKFTKKETFYNNFYGKTEE